MKTASRWIAAVLIIFISVPFYHASRLSRAVLKTWMACRQLAVCDSTAVTEQIDVDQLYEVAKWAEPIVYEIGWFESLLKPPLCALETMSIGAAQEYSELLSSVRGLAEGTWWALLGASSAAELQGSVTNAPGVPVTIDESPVQGAARMLGLYRSDLQQAYSSAEIASQGLHGRWRDRAALVRTALGALLILADSGDKDQTWLLCFQNTDEIRATGGFVSATALLKLVDGELIISHYQSSQNVEAYFSEHPVAPLPLQTYMGAGVLLMRDANWSPDFGSSAAVMASLYQMDTGQAVDGVVAIDPEFLRLVLEALGPVWLADYQVTVSSENCWDLFISYWEQPCDAPELGQVGGFSDWLAHHKDFGGAVLEAFMNRASDLGVSDLPHLLELLDKTVGDKHIMAWSSDTALQADIRALGMSGGLSAGDCDYFMIVDTNMGWNKVDRNVQQSIHYSVREASEGLVARLELDYLNDSDPENVPCVQRARYEASYEELANGCYWDYVRVYVPMGSELLTVTGTSTAVDVGYANGLVEWGTFLTIPAAATHRLIFEYVLPQKVVERIAEGSYALAIQGQPGRPDTPCMVEVLNGQSIQLSLTGDVRFTGPELGLVWQVKE